jgi:hypothetical protein
MSVHACVIYMYECVYLNMYIYNAYIYRLRMTSWLIYLCLHKYRYMYTHTDIYIYIHTYINIHIYIFTYMYVLI